METQLYSLGVILAVLAGVNNNLGSLLQKKVVNIVARAEHFGRSLARSPTWLVGFLMQIVLGTILMMTAQTFVGPGIVPGLMAGGLIVLAIGSVKLLHESLSPTEILGVALMIAAITMISQSHLSIQLYTANLIEPGFVTRAASFTSILFGLIFGFYLLQKWSSARRGLLLSSASGLLVALSNFWVALLIGVFDHVMGGTFQPEELVLFICACVILVGGNICGLVAIQKAFTAGQVSNLVPIQYIPMQISPIFTYFLVFAYPAPSIGEALLGIVGICLVIVAGVLLSRRKAQIDDIKISTIQQTAQ